MMREPRAHTKYASTTTHTQNTTHTQTHTHTQNHSHSPAHNHTHTLTHTCATPLVFPPSCSALEGLLGKGVCKEGQVMSLRLDVSTPSPPNKGTDEFEDEESGTHEPDDTPSRGQPAEVTLHLSPLAPQIWNTRSQSAANHVTQHAGNMWALNNNLPTLGHSAWSCNRPGADMHVTRQHISGLAVSTPPSGALSGALGSLDISDCSWQPWQSSEFTSATHR